MLEIKMNKGLEVMRRGASYYYIGLFALLITQCEKSTGVILISKQSTLNHSLFYALFSM